MQDCLPSVSKVTRSITPETCSVTGRRSGITAYEWGFNFATDGWGADDPFEKPILRGFGSRELGRLEHSTSAKRLFAPPWSGIVGARPRRHKQRTPLLQCNRGRVPNALAICSADHGEHSRSTRAGTIRGRKAEQIARPRGASHSAETVVPIEGLMGFYDYRGELLRGSRILLRGAGQTVRRPP
jgi:hypothetical protein